MSFPQGRNGGTSGKEYQRLKDIYLRYITFYKSVNNGSTSGATTFAEFYLAHIFYAKYNDPRILQKLGSK